MKNYLTKQEKELLKMARTAKRIKLNYSVSVVNGNMRGVIIGDEEFVDTLRDGFNELFNKDSLKTLSTNSVYYSELINGK